MTIELTPPQLHVHRSFPRCRRLSFLVLSLATCSTQLDLGQVQARDIVCLNCLFLVGHNQLRLARHELTWLTNLVVLPRGNCANVSEHICLFSARCCTLRHCSRDCPLVRSKISKERNLTF